MKTIKLSIEQAKELYNTNKEFRTTILHEFTDSELGVELILKDWEDLDFKDNYSVDLKGNIIHHIGNIQTHLNVPTEKHAKSMIAFAKLSMLMHDLGDECDVDWRDDNEIKYCISRFKNELDIKILICSYRFLAFKTYSILDAFLKKHERLIKDYFMID